MKRFFTLESWNVSAWLLCSALLLGGGCSNSHLETGDLHETSMIEVIANPAKFHHCQVEMIGFLRLHPDGDLLLFHKDDYDNVISSNSLSLRIPESMRPEIRKLNLSYVHIRGVIEYSSSGKRHFKFLCLNNIKLVELHSKPDRPLAIFTSEYAKNATKEQLERIKQGLPPEGTNDR